MYLLCIVLQKKLYFSKMEKIDTDLLRMYMMGGAAPRHTAVKQKSAAAIVDLHIKPQHATAEPAIALQIAAFEKEIDNALFAGMTAIRLIHGNGKGKLKNVLHSYLSNHPHVRSFENNFHPNYGWGSTLVIFK